MTRTKIAAGNWKMHGDLISNRDLFEAFNDVAAGMQAELMLFVPALYLDAMLQWVDESDSAIKIGAQTVSEHDKGAYTGEISAAMLKDIGCDYTLVGHSERRSLYHESDATVAAKFAAALRHAVQPILCVGETLDEREAGDTMTVVKRQLDAVGDLVGYEVLCANVIAYEPVWAIGTGKTATPEQAQEVHAAIRAHLQSKAGEAAQTTRILYGGSVNDSNAAQLFAMDDIDGGLVGGASLKADAFTAICQAAG